MSAGRHLVLFVKQPRMGRVKTRLAAEVGPVAALGFYRTNVARLLRWLGTDPRWRTWLAVAPDTAVADPWPAPAGVEIVPQGPGDLGTRMDRAFHVLPPGEAVIVGADIPGVRPHHVARAFRALGDHDAVFGPALDGGYWLVGMRRRPRLPTLFQGVRWSGPEALADSIASLPKGFRVATVDQLEDVDDADSLGRHTGSSPNA